MTALRVGGITITPPVYRASGGVSAGLQLMQRVAELVETRMLLMGAANETTRQCGLVVDTIPAQNAFGRFVSYLPNRVETLLWRADFGKWLDQHKPEIVHLHNPHPPGAMLKAARACMARNIPYVLSTHGFVEYDNFSRAYGAPAWQRPLIDRIVRRPLLEVVQNASRILMLSPEEKAMFENMGVQADRLDVVSNGVDPFYLEAFSSSLLAELTGRFDLPDGKPVVFFVGNHTANKGVDLLLKARDLMKSDAQIVVGGGLRSESEHSDMLLAAGVDPESHDIIFTGFLTREELKALYERCDVFAFPSRADTLPLVILEAMAAGKPVVSTRIGGIPYQVTADTGILIESGDANDLAIALDKLVDNSDLRQTMGEAGRERALEVFNWERSANRAVTIYRDVVGD